MSDHRDAPSSAGGPHPRREFTEVAAQIAGRLESRGIIVRDTDPAEELARLLDAVEAFERAVAARGGDSYLNPPLGGHPERAEFVPPRRRPAEAIASYSARIRAAAEKLGKEPG